MANGTGGPTQQQPQRAQVGNQLYRMGKQLPGPTNPFAGFGPQTPPPMDPFSLIPQQQAPQQAPPPLYAQGDPNLAAAMPQTPPQPEKPMDRFPRLTRLLGRPVVPNPKPKKV